MALPTNRKEFAQLCLRNLGKPLIEVNVSEEQVDDKIDYALSYYKDYHYDGSEKMYISYELTQTDIDNKYIIIPEEVIGIVSIFPIGGTLLSTGMFSSTYQLALDSFTSSMGGQLSNYVSMRTNMEMMQQILMGETPVRYNRHRNRLHVDTNWASRSVGDWIVIDCYVVVDPEEFTDVWKDKWLIRYTTELIREQWGFNLSKFSGIQMPGGVTFNGQAILDMARENLKVLEDEMLSSYSLPAADFIG